MATQTYPVMIDDSTARKIACAWHGGGGSALYAFCSTGAIDTGRPDHDIDAELRLCLMPANGAMQTIPTMPERVAVQLLRVYCIRAGKRGPQPGWAEVSIEREG